MRASIEIHDGTLTDLPEVARLCLMARDESVTPSQICSADTERLKSQLGVMLSVEGGRIFVATHDGHTVGFVLARVIAVNIYNDEPVMYIEALYVDQSLRRRGVGHALLTAVANAAVEARAVEVFSVPIPGSRGVQRFLARMGFAPAAAHRVVATAVLLRKLETEGAPQRRGTRTLEDLIARRRKARIETHSGPVDLRSLHGRLEADAAAAAEAAADAVVASRLAAQTTRGDREVTVTAAGAARAKAIPANPGSGNARVGDHEAGSGVDPATVTDAEDELFELEKTIEFPPGEARIAPTPRRLTSASDPH